MTMTRQHAARLGTGVAAVALAWAGALGGLAGGATAATPPDGFDAQVIGGQPAAEGQYPWLVGVGSGDGTPYEVQSCGGSVITPDVVLTVAHCVVDAEADDLVVLSGSVDLTSDDVVETEVADVHVPEDYGDPVESTSDWALLLLDESLDIDPVELAQDPDEYDTLETVGWGSRADGSYPAVAHWVEVPFVGDDTCRDVYAGEFDVESMVCAGDLEDGGVDACDGDSGGPLLAPGEDGEQVQVGIVSWGYGCAEPGLPGVYAEVADFNDPIEQVVEDWED